MPVVPRGGGPPEGEPDEAWPALTDLAVQLSENGIALSRRESFILADIIGTALKASAIHAKEPRVNDGLKRKVSSFTRKIEEIARVLDDVHRLPRIEGTVRLRDMYYGVRPGSDELPGGTGDAWSIGTTEAFEAASDIARLLYIRRITGRIYGPTAEEDWFGKLAMQLYQFGETLKIIADVDEDERDPRDQAPILPFKLPIIPPDTGGVRSAYGPFIENLVAFYIYTGRTPELKKKGTDAEYKDTEFFKFLTIVNSEVPPELFREPSTLGKEASEVLRRIAKGAGGSRQN